MRLARIGPLGAAMLFASACGGGESNPGQPSADERRQLDNIAAKLDADAETFDTSPDSLVPAEGADANTSAGNMTAPVETTTGNAARVGTNSPDPVAPR